MTRSAAPDLVSPAFCSMPDYVSTLGDEVADLADLAGFAPDPEQRLALDMLFATKSDGLSAAFMFSMVGARQNLKTGWLKQACLGWLYITEQPLIVWSAHEFGTSQEAFRDMCELIEGCPDLDREVKQIHRGNGDEAIELIGNRRLKFKARTKGGGRGLTGHKVVLDESMFLQPVHMGALLPTLSAVPDPQVVMAGSAGMVDSAVQRGTRDRGRAGGDPRLAYLEWADDLPGGCARQDCDHRLGSPACVLDDVERWRRANPALGRRISVDYIAAERRELTPDEFARERLGWWDDPIMGTGLIDPALWLSLLDMKSKVEAVTGFGFDVSPNSVTASIVAAGVRSDGLTHVELLQNDPGTGWCLARLVALWGKWQVPIILDPKSPASAFIAPLEQAGVSVLLPKTDEYANACQAFVTEVNGLRVRHQGWPALDRAIEAAKKRDIGDGGWGWARKKTTADISPLVAATLALHGMTSAPSVDVSTQIF